MKTKIAAIIVISAVLFDVFVAPELMEHEKWTRLRGMHCDFVHMVAGETGKPIELDNLLDSKPDGYIAKLQYTTLGIDGNYIYLSSAHTINELGGSRAYIFEFGGWAANRIRLLRFDTDDHTTGYRQLYNEEHSDVFVSTAPADVIIAVTNDATITVTIEGETILTYHDRDPFPIKYIGMDSIRRGGFFYYNCITKLNNTHKVVVDIKTKTMKLDMQHLVDVNSATKFLQILAGINAKGKILTDLINHHPKNSNATTEHPQTTGSIDPRIEVWAYELEVQRTQITKLIAELQQITGELSQQRQVNADLQEKLQKQEQIIADCREFYGSIHTNINQFKNSIM